MRTTAQDWPLTTIFGSGSPFPAEPPAPALSPEQKIQPLLGALCKLAGFFATVFALGLLLVSAYVALRVSEQLGSWPRTHAEVLSSEVYEKALNSARDFEPVHGLRVSLDRELRDRLAHLPSTRRHRLPEGGSSGHA